MEFLRQLFHGKGYIDGITIINLDGEILFSAKLNSKFSNRKEREAYQALVGQNFFDVFENLNAKNSSMIRAMEVGLPVYVENQLPVQHTRALSCRHQGSSCILYSPVLICPALPYCKLSMHFFCPCHSPPVLSSMLF